MRGDTETPERSTWAPPLLWTAGYLAVGITIAFTQPEAGQSPWYPPTAIGIALLLRCGRRWWPLILGSELLISYAQYRMVGPAAASAAVTTLEALVGVTLLLRWRLDPMFTRGEDVMCLAVAAGTVALGGSFLGVPLVRAAGFVNGSWLDMIRVWFIGELTGVAVFLPVLLLVAARPTQLRRRLGGLPVAQALELAVLTVVGVVLAGWVFWRIGPGSVEFADVGTTLVCLVPVLWVAIRFGRARTAVVTVTMNVVVIMAVVQGHRDIVRSLVDYESVQFFILVVSLAGLGVAVTVDAERRARSLQQAVVDASPVAVVLVDGDRHVRVWNPAAERIFGWSASEALGREPPAVTADGQQAFQARLAAQRLGPIEETVVYRHRDGHLIDGRLHGAPVRDAEGEITGMMGLIEDVTDRLADERQRALLTTAIDQAAEAVLVTDLTPAIVYANPAAVAFSGYTLDEMLGRNPRLFKSGVHDKAFYAALWAELTAGRSWHGVLVNRHKDGTLYEQDSTISPVFGADGRLQAYVAVKRDLTLERRLEAELETEQQERRDLTTTLSAVATGPHPEATAEALCATACSIDDIDGAILLRRLPDGNLFVLGADVPETVPIPTVPLNQEVSAAVLALTRTGPWFLDAREAPLGTGPTSDALEREHLTGLTGVPIIWEGRTVGVLACGTRHPDGVERMRRRGAAVAEIATHAAALLGPQLAALEDRDLGRSRIRDLIDQGRFHPVFQPVISLGTGAVVGYEALTRFDDGTRPDLVFAEAHEVGMGHDLERACLRASLDAAQGLPEATWLAVNVSPTLVLAGEVAPLLAGLDRRFVLEITEHVEIPDYAALRHGLERIDGVWVSVDDAGAGYASLRHILELRPDIVKLDIALVRGIDADPARQAMVAGMRHFASETLTHLLAEGVETQAEADTVRRLGVEYVQGYLFGRPEPLPDPA